MRAKAGAALRADSPGEGWSAASASPAIGAKSPRIGSGTRELLLDAAESLFADHGYDGTSLRDIANLAQQNMALSTYHFGTKERLFEEVIRRRAVELESARIVALHKIDLSALAPSDAIRALIEAYTLPVIAACYGPSPQWHAHVRLLSQLVSVKRWQPLLWGHYDHCGRIFLDRFQQVLPHVNPNAMLDAFSSLGATILYVCSYTNRFGGMKAKPRPQEDKLSQTTANLIKFVHAGFMAL